MTPPSEAFDDSTVDLRLCAAYGRRYSTKDEVLADWQAGKDFKIWQGPYCSIRDVPAMEFDGYKPMYFDITGQHPELNSLELPAAQE